MRIWHMTRARVRSLFFSHRRDADLREELRLHIDREAEWLEASGLPPSAARLRAVQAFGGFDSAEEACRDVRGRLWFDELVRDVRFASRSFRRTPLAAFTIVGTVGLGLGLIAVVFSVLNLYVFLPDKVRDPHELFVVANTGPEHPGPALFSRDEYKVLLDETALFSDAFAQSPDVDAWVNGRRFEGAFVTGNFFDTLGVRAAIGRSFTPADDTPGETTVILISHRAWTTHFDADPDVVGKTVKVNDTPAQVIGVTPEGFRGLMVASLDFWAPLAHADALLPRGNQGRTTEVFVVGRLASGLLRNQAQLQLQAWDARRAADRGVSRPVANLILEPQTGTVPRPLEAALLFVPLFFAFGLILVIGCANVANLLFARAVARQREIGVRLAIGASRRRIVRQLLVENLLLALASAAVGYALSRLILEGIVRVFVGTFPADFGNIRLETPPGDWRVVVFLLGGALVSTVFFALAPALQATRVDLVRAIRGDVGRAARPGRPRDVLVVLQVTGSALLLVCAAIFLRSAWAAAAVDPGIRTADTINVAVLAEDRRATLLDIVRREPAIHSVAASWPGGPEAGTAIIEPMVVENARGAAAPTRPTVRYRLVSPEYFDVLGIDILQGRGFRDTERDPAAAVAIVSAATARGLWPRGNAVGQVIRLAPETNAHTQPPSGSATSPRSVVVIGIARDVPGFRLGGARTMSADVYLPLDVESARTTLTLRVHGDPASVRRTLTDHVAGIDPNMADVTLLQTLATLESYLLSIPFWTTLLLGAVGLLLTASGLFGVLSYLVAQRTKEIGVRMALGATRRTIVPHVLAQSVGPVATGLVIGSSLVAGMGAVLLATPAADTIGTLIGLFDPVAYAVGLTTISVACFCGTVVPALRAARIEPLLALKQD